MKRKAVQQDKDHMAYRMREKVKQLPQIPKGLHRGTATEKNPDDLSHLTSSGPLMEPRQTVKTHIRTRRLVRVFTLSIHDFCKKKMNTRYPYNAK